MVLFMVVCKTTPPPLKKSFSKIFFKTGDYKNTGPYERG